MPSARLLVADSDDDALLLTASRLARAGHDVIVAHDGAEALATAQRELPDLCVLDVMLRGLSGYDVTRRLRSDPHTRGIPVILLTARLALDGEQPGFEADATVRKPFSGQELRERIAAVLSVRTPRAAAAPPARS